MSSFLDLDAAQRRNVIAITADKCGLAAVSVEKDYMVCSALRVLFSVPDASAHLTFKGGTSLSKAYGLIERFSEDVDIVVAREYIGVKPVPDDLSSLTRSAKSKYVKAVQQSLEHWIQNVAAPYFSNAPRLSDGSPLWTCRIDDATKHRDTLLLEYVSVIDGPAPVYIRPSVRLEFGTRADRWPAETRTVQSYLVEQFADSIPEDPVSVVALRPERTFLEKLCHVFEELTRENGRIPRPAQSRHFYDLYCLIRAGFGERAVGDLELFERVVQHRMMLYHIQGVDYSRMFARDMPLVPDENQHAQWLHDYEQMRENMLFGDSPDFATIIAVMEQFASQYLRQ